jgi:hypothetical protein
MTDPLSTEIPGVAGSRVKPDVELYFLVALVVVSIVMRWIGLDHWPGINGDEAFYAGDARLFLHGLPFSCRTLTGRIITPTYALPTLLLQAFFAPNAWLLRLPAFISGTLSAIFAYPLLKRVLDQPTARIATAWTTCLAVHIAYSRCAWESSQSVPATLLVVYFALRGSPWKTALAWMAATVIHTANVFLFPIAFAPILYDLHQAKRLPRTSWLILWGICLWFIGLLLVNKALPNYQMRIPTAGDCGQFLVGFTRIFSGVLMFSGFSAALRPGVCNILDAATTSGMVLLIATGFRRLKGRDIAFAAGVIVAAAAIFAVANIVPFSVGFERYSLWLALPSLVVFALLWPKGIGARIAAYALSVAMLASFVTFYFVPMAEFGGSSARQCHAGKSDPKYEAAKWISADAAHASTVCIVPEDEEMKWVVVACLLDRHERKLDLIASQSIEDLQDVLLRRNGYLVGYGDGNFGSVIAQLSSKNPSQVFVEKDFLDSAGLPFVKVWKAAKR